MQEMRTAARPSVVVVGTTRLRTVLVALLESWGWTVAATAADDLAGIAAARRTRADLMVLDGGVTAELGEGDLDRASLAPCAVIRLVDLPHDLMSHPGDVLGGVPSAMLEQAFSEAIASSVAPALAGHS